MNYIEQHSFSQQDPSSLLSLEHYIPDQQIESYRNGAVKYSVSQKCFTLQSQLQQILELNDKTKLFNSTLTSIKNRKVFQAFNIMRVLRIEDSLSNLSYNEEESSLQTFIYNLHNAKLFLDLMDLLFKRKEQKKMIEAFMKIKIVRKKVVIYKPRKQQTKINVIKCKPALLLLKSIIEKKKHNAFLTILKSIRDKRERSIHSAFTDISFSSFESYNRDGYSNFSSPIQESSVSKGDRSKNRDIEWSDNVRKYETHVKRQSFYEGILKEHNDLFSKKNRSGQVQFRR